METHIFHLWCHVGNKQRAVSTGPDEHTCAVITPLSTDVSRGIPFCLWDRHPIRRSGPHPVSLSTSLWSYLDPQTLVIPPLLGMYITILVHYRGGDFLILCRRQVLDKQKKHSRGHVISHHELNGLKFPEKVTPVLKVLEG